MTCEHQSDIAMSETLRKLVRATIDFEADARRINMLGRAKAAEDAAFFDRFVAKHSAALEASGKPDVHK